jgi:threonine dehydratase
MILSGACPLGGSGLKRCVILYRVRFNSTPAVAVVEEERAICAVNALAGLRGSVSDLE